MAYNQGLTPPLHPSPLPSPSRQGTCEYEGAAIGVGGGGVPAEEGRARALTTDRLLYNLPTFVAPLQGCMKMSKCLARREDGRKGQGRGGRLQERMHE